MAESSKKLYTFDVCEVDDSGILCISLKEADKGFVFDVCNPSVICRFLESQQKDQDVSQIIEAKDEDGLVIYHFHCGLKILGDSSGNFPIPFHTGLDKGDGSNVSIFHNVLDFSKVTFSGEICFVCATFQGQANFIGSKFEKLVEFLDVTFCGCTFFNGAIFQSRADFLFARFYERNSFHDTTFEARAILKKTEFWGQVNFSFASFHKDTFFIDTNFKEGVDFTTSVFHKYACFYGATFIKPPNFTRAVFGSELNLVNSKLQCGFYEIEEFLKEREKYEKPKDGINLESRLSQFTNDYRDSFRLMKNALLKSNNALDASIYHRAELYCKEIELKHKDKNSKTFRDRVDQCVLAFYRLTSDHHTDLPKILSWIIVAIGVFGTALFALRYGVDLQGFIESHSKNVPFAQDILNKDWLNYQEYLMVTFYGVMGLSFCFLWISSDFWRRVRQICVTPFALVVLAMICINPKYILGIATLFEANRSESTIFWLENLFIVIYIITMFLLLFSLQKTARKNSIVVA